MDEKIKMPFTERRIQSQNGVGGGSTRHLAICQRQPQSLAD